MSIMCAEQPSRSQSICKYYKEKIKHQANIKAWPDTRPHARQDMSPCFFPFLNSRASDYNDDLVCIIIPLSCPYP